MYIYDHNYTLLYYYYLKSFSINHTYVLNVGEQKFCHFGEKFQSEHVWARKPC